MAPHNHADCVGNYCDAVLSGEIITSAACWHSSPKGEELGHLDPLAKNKGKTPVFEHDESKGVKLSALDPLGTDGLEIDDK